jgi:hypothetical protein
MGLFFDMVHPVMPAAVMLTAQAAASAVVPNHFAHEPGFEAAASCGALALDIASPVVLPMTFFIKISTHHILHDCVVKLCII